MSQETPSTTEFSYLADLSLQLGVDITKHADLETRFELVTRACVNMMEELRQIKLLVDSLQEIHNQNAHK